MKNMPDENFRWFLRAKVVATRARFEGLKLTSHERKNEKNRQVCDHWAVMLFKTTTLSTRYEDLKLTSQRRKNEKTTRRENFRAVTYFDTTTLSARCESCQAAFWWP